MKKILSIIAVALLMGSLAFAEDAPKAGITLGGWGRLIWAPVVSNVDAAGAQGVGMGLGTSWGRAPRIGFTIAGNSEFVGFAANIGVDNNSFSITDNTQGWIKPFPGLMLQIGRAFNDTLRGSVGYGQYNWIRTDWYGDDGIFKRVGGNEGGDVAPLNAILSYTIAGLFVYVEFAQNGPAGGAGWSGWSGTTAGGANDTQSIWNNMSFGVGYTIDGIGMIRAQKVGYADLTSGNGTGQFGYYQAAFTLTALKGSSIAIGAWIPYASGTVAASQLAGWTFQLPVFASIGIDKATINALFVLRLDDTTKGYSSNVSFLGGLGFDYDIGEGIGFTSDVRIRSHNFSGGTYLNDGKADTIATPQVTPVVEGMVGITKGFSNGMIGVAFQLTTSAFAGGGAVTQDPTKLNWAVPVRFEYWF